MTEQLEEAHQVIARLEKRVEVLEKSGAETEQALNRDVRASKRVSLKLDHRQDFGYSEDDSDSWGQEENVEMSFSLF